MKCKFNLLTRIRSCWIDRIWYAYVLN